MPRIGRAAHEVSFQEPGGHEPGRRIDTIDRRCDRDPLRGPGPERSRQQAEGIDPAVPLVACARPRQAHEGDQVAGDVGGGLIGACAGLGEPDHRVLDDRDVGVADTAPSRRVAGSYHSSKPMAVPDSRYQAARHPMGSSCGGRPESGPTMSSR